MQRRTATVSLLRAALVAALVGVGAVMSIPIGPVPVTFQVLVIAIAALVLSPIEALAAMGIYIVLGTIGAPVFSGGTAGPGVLIGPTGGFIMGFLLGTPLAAVVRRWITGRIASEREGSRMAIADASALFLLLLVVYVVGWAYLALTTGRSAGEAFALAVAPFVVIDIGKCVVAVIAARAIRAAGFGDRLEPDTVRSAR